MRLLAVCFSPPEGAIADPFCAIVNEIAKIANVTVLSSDLRHLNKALVNHVLIEYKSSNPLSFFGSHGIFKAFDRFRNEKYDAVLWFSTNVANVLVLPFVHASRHYMWCHEPRPGNRTTAVKRVMYKINDSILSLKATKIIVAGRSVVLDCPAKWKSKLEICPIPPVDEFEDVQVSNANGDQFAACDKEDVFRITFFGSMQAYKGLDILALAFRRVIAENVDINFELEVVGAGDQSCFPELLSLSEDFPERVFINNNFIPAVKLYDVIKRASIVVFPYLSATGTTVLSTAFGLKCCVVASSVGNFSDYIVNNQNGFLVPPGNIDALVEVLSRCSLNSNLCERVSMQGNVFFQENLRLDIVARKLRNILTSQ